MEKVNFNFVQPPTKMVNVVHEGDQKMKIHLYKGIRFNKLAIGHQISKGPQPLLPIQYSWGT